VDEAALLAECAARFGPVASVKVMWPRRDRPGDAAAAEADAGGGHAGYVAFMARDHAESALVALDGAFLGGRTIRAAWDRAVPLPAVPLRVPDGHGGVSLVRAASDLRAPPGARAAAAAALLPEAPLAPPPLLPPAIRIAHPADPRAAFVIDTLASYVVSEGPAFELAVMVRAAQAAAAAAND